MEGNKLVLGPTAGAQGGTVGCGGSAVALEKQQQKAIKSRILDHVGAYLRFTQARLAAPSVQQTSHIQPVFGCSLDMMSPMAYPQTPASSIGTKFVTSSFFRHRAAINHLVYTPDGRRLLCAGNNGNVSLWNGANFENELGPGIQAHEASPIRCMVFSHSGLFLLSCDDMGRVKFSKPTLEVLQVYHAHKEPCRSVGFSPTDFKFATGSDDSTVRVFDTFRGQELSMTGHGGDVRWVDWHPTKSVIASCSKDACIKLWDPRVGACLSTLHGHKNGIFQVKWNCNGHWLLSCSRDQLVKLYDVRMLRDIATFAGHGRDVTCVSWHPQHEEVFVSGAIDGSLMLWLASRPDAQGIIPAAHDASVWTTAWHPLGHVLASAGADQKCQFWCRKRPGDIWQDGFGQCAGSSATGAAMAATFGEGTTASGGIMSGPSASAGVASMAVPGPPGLGGIVTSSRLNVIPGIGAVLDQLSTANLQGAIPAGAPPRCTAPSGTGANSGGSRSRSSGWASTAGSGLTIMAGAKRSREDGFRGPPIRFGDRDLEREWGPRGERGNLEMERGPVKIAKMDGPAYGSGDGVGPALGVGHGRRRDGGSSNMSGPPAGTAGYGSYPPPGRSGPDGHGPAGPGPAYLLQRGPPGAPAQYVQSRDDPASDRPGPSGSGMSRGGQFGRGALELSRLPPFGGRRRPPPMAWHPREDLGEAPYPYVQEPHGYGHSLRPSSSLDPHVGPGSARPYGGEQHVYGGDGYQEGGNSAPQGSYDRYRGAEGPGQDAGPGPAPYRGHPRGGGLSRTNCPGRGRGRGRSPEW